MHRVLLAATLWLTWASVGNASLENDGWFGAGWFATDYFADGWFLEDDGSEPGDGGEGTGVTHLGIRGARIGL